MLWSQNESNRPTKRLPLYLIFFFINKMAIGEEKTFYAVVKYTVSRRRNTTVLQIGLLFRDDYIARARTAIRTNCAYTFTHLHGLNGQRLFCNI